MLNIAKVFAAFYQKVTAVAKVVVADIPKVEAGITKVESAAPIVEAVTAAIPTYGPLAVTFEQVGFMVLGELSQVLAAGGAAAADKLVNAGLDINVIQTVQHVYQTEAPQIAALAAAK